jgi:hypothetical protein
MFCPKALGARVGGSGPIRKGPDPYGGGGGPFVYVEVLDLPRGYRLRTWGSGTHHRGLDPLVKSLSISPPYTHGSTGPTHKTGIGVVPESEWFAEAGSSRSVA